MKSVSWEWTVALVAVTAVNILTFAPPWLVLLPGLRFWAALMMTQATTALSIVVPGGAAVGIATAYAMLRRSGFAPAAVARSVTLVSVWNQLANLAYPIVALFLLTMAGEETAVLATAAFIGVAILGVAVAALVLVLYSNRMAVDIGDLAARGATWVKGRFHRAPVAWGGSNFERFRVDVVDILKRRWHLLTLATLAGSLTVFVVLLVSLRALSVPSAEVSVMEAFAAWSLARLLGSIPITPGGIGVVELSLTAALIGFGGNNAGVVAAVLVFRFLTIVPTLVLGMVAAAVWRRISKSAPADAGLSGRQPLRPRLWRRFLRALEIAGTTYVQTAGGQRAAAISYRVLFSLIPFVALLVSVLELVLPESAQQDVVSWLVGVASLPDELAQSVDAAVKDAGPPASATGAVALAGLIWAASGMMASVRSAFQAVWGSEAYRPYLRGKLLDFVLVLGAGVLVVSAFGLSLVVQVVTETSSEIAEELGGGESATSGLGAVAQLGASLALASARVRVPLSLRPACGSDDPGCRAGRDRGGRRRASRQRGLLDLSGPLRRLQQRLWAARRHPRVPAAGVRSRRHPAPGRVRGRCLAGNRDRAGERGDGVAPQPPRAALHAGSSFGTANRQMTHSGHDVTRGRCVRVASGPEGAPAPCTPLEPA